MPRAGVPRAIAITWQQRRSRALAALPRGQRAAVTLRLLEEKTFREIAETFGVTEGTIKVQFARGLRRLRREMEQNRSERS